MWDPTKPKTLLKSRRGRGGYRVEIDRRLTDLARRNCTTTIAGVSRTSYVYPCPLPRQSDLHHYIKSKTLGSYFRTFDWNFRRSPPYHHHTLRVVLVDLSLYRRQYIIICQVSLPFYLSPNVPFTHGSERRRREETWPDGPLLVR